MRTPPRRFLPAASPALALAVALGAGCEREKQPAPRTEPWLARAEEAGAPAVRRSYAVVAAISVPFELPVGAAGPSGAFRVGRGSLDVALDDLAQTTGSVEIDVASVLMDGADVTESRQRSQVAQSWLDVGSSRPEVERERLRWARFRLREVTRASAVAAWSGRSVTFPRAEDAATGGEAGTDAGGVLAPVEVEARAVELELRGDLELHERRVEFPVAVRATFFFTEAPAPGVVPSRIVLETPQPIPIALATFDVKPRDAKGTHLVAEEALMGNSVGRVARVRGARLELLPRATP